MFEKANHDHGFSLIELLVVMIIIGILAAIAIPSLLSQRAHARDASTKADVSTVGKEIASYFVDGKGTISLDYISVPGHVVLTDGAGYTNTINLTNGTASPISGGFANLDDPVAWCVALTDNAGVVQVFNFSAKNGLSTGICP